MSATFASLAVPSYRLYAMGGVVSNTGTWMGRVAQDWLVLTQLTNHSSTALGTVTGLQFLPFLLLAPWTGMIADRFPKRRIMLATQTVLMASAGLLGALTLTGAVQLWHVYAAALVQGIATAVDNPARQTFVSEMVGQGCSPTRWRSTRRPSTSVGWPAPASPACSSRHTAQA